MHMMLIPSLLCYLSNMHRERTDHEQIYRKQIDITCIRLCFATVTRGHANQAHSLGVFLLVFPLQASQENVSWESYADTLEIQSFLIGNVYETYRMGCQS